MRTCSGGTCSAPNYLLSDHLGSTSLTTDASGNLISELRYSAWGEVRYTNGTTPTDYTYTGQYSYASDFGLQYYNARWYDPSLGRFAQADSVVPGGAQGYDRYAYVQNNPLRYTDPTGHMIDDGCRTEGCDPTEKMKGDDNGRQFNQRTEYLKCMRGEDIYCSATDKIDRWAWKNIPSAVSIHGGYTYQAGFGGEFGQFVESDFVLNWRSFEISRLITTGHQGYLGTPTIGQLAKYRGITLIYGASSNENLVGPSAIIGGVRGADEFQTVSVMAQRSQAVDSNGVRLINSVTGRTVDSYQVDLSGGVSLFPTGIQAGGFLAQAESKPIIDTDLKGSMLFGLIFGP